jgi:thioredoxin-like negative regulator of GroEL
VASIIELQQHRIQSLDDSSFYQRLEQVPDLSVVFFSKRGCSSCRTWKQLLKHLAREDGISVFEVDVEQNMALANEYELFHLPALFLFKDGEFHSELQSEARLPAFREALWQACHAPAQEAP